jgi:hypothetical protein
MMGIMRLQGYGKTPVEPNYEQALNWFESAGTMDDPRITDAALHAVQELNGYLNEAHRVNDAIYDNYARRSQGQELL